MEDSDVDLVVRVKQLGRGYGWAKFAENVEAQGWVSDRQRDTLIVMLRRLTSPRKNRRRSIRYGDYESDISDSEAMSFGEYY